MSRQPLPNVRSRRRKYQVQVWEGLGQEWGPQAWGQGSPGGQGAGWQPAAHPNSSPSTPPAVRQQPPIPRPRMPVSTPSRGNINAQGK